MITLNHIAYNIAQSIGKEKDSAFVEQVKFQVMYYRSLIFRRDYERLRKIPSALLQTIPCVEMEEVDAAQCYGLEVDSPVYRTKQTIPAPMNLKGYSSFYYVGTIDWMNGFSYINPNRLETFRSSRYGSLQKRFYYANGRIYLVNVKADRISIKAVFEDPMELRRLKNCNGEPVYTEKSIYPVTADLIQRITQSILSGEGRIVEPEHDVKHDQ